MRAFGELFDELDATTSLNAKLAAMVRYFASAPPEDAAWGAYFLSGRRLKRVVGGAALRAWLVECTGLPAWLLDETHAEVGDLAETIALLVDAPAAGECEEAPLSQWIERLLDLPEAPPEQRQARVTGWWRTLDVRSCFLLNKLLTGELRVGVSSGLVERALAEATGTPRAVIAHRLTGAWRPGAEFWSFLRAPAHEEPGGAARPYPFCLAAALGGDPADLGPLGEWLVEWKWDGIRAQIMRREHEIHVWSRGEELVSERFPELLQRAAALPAGVVLDGEILAWRDGRVQPFGDLQQRIGRKKLSERVLRETPVQFLAYDLLELDGRDIRGAAMHERRKRLETLIERCGRSLELSPLIAAADWDELRSLRSTSRERFVEGMMLKRIDSPYAAGRQRGIWWKWKIEPYTFDGVLIYAQPGRGRRANLLTDYTFAVRKGEQLVPVAKAYSGLSDEEILRVDRWIRQNTLERFGPVRAVRPELVFEIAFEGVSESTRHKSGLAVRFPRIARWRQDKPAAEANTLEDLRGLLLVRRD